MSSRRFAIAMVWFATILLCSVIFTTSIPDEVYLRAFAWGVATVGMVLLMGRPGVWFIWMLRL